MIKQQQQWAGSAKVTIQAIGHLLASHPLTNTALIFNPILHFLARYLARGNTVRHLRYWRNDSIL